MRATAPDLDEGSARNARSCRADFCVNSKDSWAAVRRNRA